MSRDYHTWTPAEGRLFLRARADHYGRIDAQITSTMRYGRKVT